MTDTNNTGEGQIDMGKGCGTSHRGFSEWLCPECSHVASVAGMQPYCLPQDLVQGGGLVVIQGRPYIRKPHSREFEVTPDGRGDRNPHTGFRSRDMSIVITDQIDFGVLDKKHREIGMHIIKVLINFPEGALWMLETMHTRNGNKHGKYNLAQDHQYYASESECDESLYRKLEASMKKAVNYGTPYGYK